MPRSSYGYNTNYTAELIAEMLSSVGGNIARGIERGTKMRAEEKEFRSDVVAKLKAFEAMDPDHKQEFLSTPQGIQTLRDILDPHLYTKHRPKKEGPGLTDEQIRAFGKATSKQTAELGEAEAKRGEAEAKRGQEEYKLRKTKDFEQVAKDYYENKATPQQYITAGIAAFGPGFLANAEKGLDPDYVRRQEAMKTIGTPEWTRLDVESKRLSLRDKYDIKTPEDEDAIRQLAMHLSDPNAPRPAKLPKTYEGERVEVDKTRAELERRRVKMDEVKATAELTKYALANGIAEDKVGRFVETFQRTGKPPADIPFPKDQKEEMALHIQRQQAEEMSQKLKYGWMKNPVFDQLGEQTRNYAAAGDKDNAARTSDLAWKELVKQYPDLKGQAKPGYFDWLWNASATALKGTGNVVQGAAGVGAAGAKDLLQQGRDISSQPEKPAGAMLNKLFPDISGTNKTPFQKDIYGIHQAAFEAAAPVVPELVGGAVEAGKNIYGGIKKGTEYLYGPSIGSQVSGLGKTYNEAGAPEVASGQDKALPMSPERLSELKGMKQRHLDNMKRAASIPSLSDSERMNIAMKVKALDEAGDDPMKLMDILLKLGSPDGNR